MYHNRTLTPSLMLMNTAGKGYSFDRFILSVSLLLSFFFSFSNVKISRKGEGIFYHKSYEMRVGYEGDEEVFIVSQAGAEERKINCSDTEKVRSIENNGFVFTVEAFI